MNVNILPYTNNFTFENNLVSFIFNSISYFYIRSCLLFLPILKNQLDSTYLGTIVSLLGVILVMIKMFWTLLNEPTLEFGDITKNNEPAYFITVKKKGGKGYAKNCEGKIKIENIDTHTVLECRENECLCKRTYLHMNKLKIICY